MKYIGSEVYEVDCWCMKYIVSRILSLQSNEIADLCFPIHILNCYERNWYNLHLINTNSVDKMLHLSPRSLKLSE